MTTDLGDRLNKGKPGVHLVPLDVLEELARVYDYGEGKYSAHNWEKGLEWDKGIKASLLRHLCRWSGGEDYDEESGLPHDLHIAFNALALIAMRIREKGIDDRFKLHTTDSAEPLDGGTSDAGSVQRRSRKRMPARLFATMCQV